MLIIGAAKDLTRTGVRCALHLGPGLKWTAQRLFLTKIWGKGGNCEPKLATMTMLMTVMICDDYHDDDDVVDDVDGDDVHDDVDDDHDSLSTVHAVVTN